MVIHILDSATILKPSANTLPLCATWTTKKSLLSQRGGQSLHRAAHCFSMAEAVLRRWGQHLGHIEVEFEADTGRILSYTGAPIEMTDEYPQSQS